MPIAFVRRVLQEPLWLQVWIAWLGAVNLAAFLFLRRAEARRVALAFAAAATLMSVLFSLNGYNRLLGLAHVVCWTPLLWYLLPRLRQVPTGGLYGRWLYAVAITDTISLVIDYADVFRYVVLGDRS